MQVKEKYMKQNETILNKIGLTEDIVKKWKRQGLKISYPMKKNHHYFKSQDGEVFIEAADKYTPLLSKEETNLYTQHPEKFRNDFLKQARLFFQFHTFLYSQSSFVEKLPDEKDKVSGSLALLYLFLSAMDNHYYHFDRYLVYQDYPETPVGHWWKKMKNYCIKISGEKEKKEVFLKVLSMDKNILEKFSKNLRENELNDFYRTLAVLKIFEETQQKEYQIVSGYPSKEDLLLRSGFGLWTNISTLMKNHPTVIKDVYKEKVFNLLEGHPITSTRELLLLPQLKALQEDILIQFKAEIERWL